jgi:hypothetical protein
MDADLVITIAFCLEAGLLALAAAGFAAHEVRKSRSQAGEHGTAARAGKE